MREVHFIGKDAAAEEFKEYLGDDFVEFLEQNPLPDSYELRLNAGASDKETISVLERRCRSGRASPRWFTSAVCSNR